MAKNFKKTATEQAPVYGKLLGEAEPQLKKQIRTTDSDNTQKALEVQDIQKVQKSQPSTDMQTQGRKGEKLPRINMAFSPANHEFINIMSRLSGLTLTQYVNRVIDRERKSNSHKLEQAKKLLDL